MGVIELSFACNRLLHDWLYKWIYTCFPVIYQQSTSNAVESIEVRVKYKSTSPRSTRKQITVREKGNPAGAAFVMTLRVSIDNSLLSTYSFLGMVYNFFFFRSFVPFMRISFLIK